MPFTPLDTILGTRSRIRLLRLLHARQAPVSGREAARLAGLSHHGIQSLDELTGMGIVIRREASGQNLYTFNEEHALASAVADLFEAERRQTNELMARLAEILEETGGVATAAAFGSAARGDAGPESDFDVLVLVEGESRVRAVHDAISNAAPALRRRFGSRVSPVVLSVERARRQYQDGPGFLGEALEDARSIAGAPLREVLVG